MTQVGPLPFPITAVFYADGTVNVTGAAAPVNTTLPALSGVPQVGVPYTATQGVWSNSPTSYTHQWQVAGVNATGAGATTLTYTPVAADVGQTLTLIENASNGILGAPVTSLASAAVIAAPVAFQWNPSDKAAGITLSNGNLTATHSGSVLDQGVRGTVSKAASKWHFEVRADSVNAASDVGSCGIGIANATQALTGTNWAGNNLNAIVWYDDGAVFFNYGGLQHPLATWPSYVSGNVLAIEFDEDAKTIKGKVGAGAYSAAVSYSGLTGAVFPIAVLHTGAEAFSAVAPTLAITSGFSVLS